MLTYDWTKNGGQVIWATRADLALFLEGWDMGETWACHKHNPDFYTSQLAANILETCEDYTSEISSGNVVVNK